MPIRPAGRFWIPLHFWDIPTYGQVDDDLHVPTVRPYVRHREVVGRTSQRAQHERVEFPMSGKIAAAVCQTCNWEREFTPQEAFSGNPKRSATQAAKGHASTGGCDYQSITVDVIEE